MNMLCRANDGLRGVPHEGKPCSALVPELDGFSLAHWAYTEYNFGDLWAYDSMLSRLWGGVDGEIYKTSAGWYLAIAYDFKCSHTGVWSEEVESVKMDTFHSLHDARDFVELTVARYWGLID